MAQLTWREVAAPQLSTRDLALAGQTVVQGFDRLGTLLNNREETLRKQATDAAIAQRLVQQDPNAMGQLDLTGLDRRVNLRELAAADNAHRAQLVERERANEELLNSQAWAKYGTTIEALGTAALNGDAKAEATLRAGVAEDPMFARAIGQNEAWSKIVGFRDDRIDNLLQRDEFGETVRSNKAREAGDAADRALRAREIIARERQQAEVERGRNLGLRFAEQLRLTDKDTAMAQLYEREDFKALSSTARNAVLETFGSAHNAYTSETSGTRQGLANLDGQIAARQVSLKAEGNRAENNARDPSLTALRRADTYGDTLTMDRVIKNLAPRMGWAQNDASARAVIQKILADVPGATLADVQAAIDVNGYDPGAFKYIPFADIVANRVEGAALRERVQQAVGARARGYTANEDLDVATARAPSAAAQAEIESTRAQLGRYVRAYDRGQLTVGQMNEMDRLERRLIELTQPPRGK